MRHAARRFRDAELVTSLAATSYRLPVELSLAHAMRKLAWGAAFAPTPHAS